MINFAVFLDQKGGIESLRQFTEVKPQHLDLRPVAMAAVATLLSIHGGSRPAQAPPGARFQHHSAV